MAELVRVRDKTTGHQYTISRVVAQARDELVVLEDRPAADNNGRVLPAKTQAPALAKKTAPAIEEPAAAPTPSEEKK